MPKSKINLWPFLHDYLEDEYLDETGESPYVEGFDGVPALKYVQKVVRDNMQVLGAELTDDDVKAWYDAEVGPMLKKIAPEIRDMVQRVINVYFVREYKFFFNKNNKKNPVDYVLSVDKVIEEKTGGAPPVIFNNVQTFMLNYEIKKLLDKAITITNEKYDNIVYINGRMTQGSVLNIVAHLEKTYSDYKFNYVLLDRDNEYQEIKDKHCNITVVKSLF